MVAPGCPGSMGFVVEPPSGGRRRQTVVTSNAARLTVRNDGGETDTDVYLDDPLLVARRQLVARAC